MFTVTANGKALDANSLEELDESIAGVADLRSLELSISLICGPSLIMLRSDECAFLMYLRGEGDNGFVSGTPEPIAPTAKFRLANGQVDEYPLAWCIPVDDCFKAVFFFYVNAGLRPEWLAWHES
jgi:hypothetical protein